MQEKTHGAAGLAMLETAEPLTNYLKTLTIGYHRR